jgi:hypothetical protein
LGEVTAGTWEMYFDGGDVGLTNSYEELNGVGINADGDIYLTTLDIFGVTGASGGDEDVFVCHGPTLGPDTACQSFSHFFDGSEYGLAGNDLYAIGVPGTDAPAPTPTPEPTDTPTPTPTDTPMPTDTPLPTDTPTPTPTDTPIPTDTPLPTDTPTPTPTDTPIPTDTPLPTDTPTPTPTDTPIPTDTPTPAPGSVVLYLSLLEDGSVGGLDVTNEDIVAFDGADFSLYFDGSDVGLDGLVIDAFTIVDESTILLSFQSAGAVPGVADTTDDSDIVRFIASSLGDDTAGAFEMYFDGSDVELTRDGEDVNAVKLLDDGRLLISTVDSLRVTGFSANDEDLSAFTPTSLGDDTSGTWEVYFDGGDVGLSSRTEEINGVGENASGDIYLTTIAGFGVTEISGGDEDVFICHGPTLGPDTVCQSFSFFFDGSEYGLAGNNLYAIDVP